MRNLTEAEARARAEAVEVEHYDVALDLTLGAEELGSRTTVTFRATADTFLELDCVRLVSATLDGRPLALEGNRIPLTGLGGEHQVVVEAVCAYTRSGEGLHRFVDPADGEVYVYAQAFLDDAQRFYACFDQPDLKATFALSVRAPEGHRVLSNTRGTVVDGVHVFAPTARLSTYLLTLAAGPWEGEQTWYDGIELGVWCRRSMAPHLDAAELLEITAQCFEQEQGDFGSRYPFGDTYDQVFVPEFNAGAMENPGMVTFSDETFLFRSRTTEGTRRLRAQVIAHEMAHMWFGDLVTMRWWDGVWLNESFAEFMGLHTIEATTRFQGAWADFCLGRKAWGYRADQLPTTHPVAGQVGDSRSAMLNFDGISYAKGASVLRQLVAFVGHDTFFTGLRAYLAEHAHANTDLADLLRAVERASGRDLHAWAQSWLGTTGVSTLCPAWEDGELVVRQEGPLREHVIGVGLYGEDGRLRERHEVEVSGERTVVGRVEPAPLVLVNDGDLTFAKVRFDDRSLTTVLAHLGDLEDPLARALCWGALWDACRDGQLPAGSYVEAVLRGVVAEHDPSVMETVLLQATRAAALYAPPAEQDDLLRTLASASWAAAVAPGSDEQLVRVRAAVSAELDPQLLRGLLDGSSTPAGLTVDAELRWHVVRRLAARGLIGEEQVGEELARDRTASGQLQAEAALAALPDPEVKERSWQALVGGRVTTAQARTMGGAFWQRGQQEVGEPYVERYVSAVPGFWKDLSPTLAQFLTQFLFPAQLVRDDVVDRVSDLLSEDLHAGCRRVLLEQRDDLQRALRAQQSG
ncbi:MAG TPA: aminopeptidase N [Mycobacteriales bacterium]|nr:aminopeptidase N [Mycobacteriales bacterium]